MGERVIYENEEEVKYPLRWMVVGVPVIIIIGTVLGTPHTLADRILYVKMLCNIGIGVLAWVFYLAVIRFLDKKLPWQATSHPKRWFIQLLITLPAITAFDTWTTWFWSNLMGFDFSLHRVIYTDFPIVWALTIAVQLHYQRYYLKAVKRRAELKVVPSKQVNQVAKQEGQKELWLSKGGSKYRVTIEEVAYGFRQHDVNYLVLSSGDKHLLDQSLTHLEDGFASSDLFRVNRRLLVHRQAVKGYQTLPNRQTQVTLVPAWEEDALLTKNRLAAFKAWLQPPTQS